MTYDEIVAAAKAYADRQDLEVDTNMPIFILMVEARVNRLLKTREQTTRASVPTVTDQEYYSLPEDYAGLRDIQLNTNLPSEPHSVINMELLTPYQFNDKRDQAYDGTLYYSIVANQIQIHPTQEAGCYIEIVYYQKVPPLNEVNTENWLSISHPDIYLSGLIAEIEVFAKNHEVASLWYKRLNDQVGELENSDFIERWSGSPMVTRVE